MYTVHSTYINIHHIYFVVADWASSSMVANPRRGYQNRELIFSSPSWRLREWSHEVGFAVPPRVSPLILQTRGESRVNGLDTTTAVDGRTGK